MTSASNTQRLITDPARVLLHGLFLGLLLGFDLSRTLWFDGMLEGAEASASLFAPRIAWTAMQALSLIMLGMLTLLGNFRVSRGMVRVASLLLALSFLLPGFGLGPLLGVTLCAISGICVGMLFLAAGMTLTNLSHREIVSAAVVGIIVAAIVTFSIANTPTFVALGISTASALASGVIVSLVMPSTLVTDRPTPSQVHDFPWLSAIMVSVSGLFSSILLGTVLALFHSESLAGAYPIAMVLIALGILTTLAIIAFVKQWSTVVWLPPFFLLFQGLFLASVGDANVAGAASALLLSATVTFRLLALVIFAALASEVRSGKSTFLALLLAFSSIVPSSFTAQYVVGLLPTTAQNIGSIAGLMSLALVVLLALIALIGHQMTQQQTQVLGEHPQTVGDNGQPVTDANTSPASVLTTEEAHDGAADSQGPVEVDTVTLLERRFAEIADNYDLTAREREIADLTARGYSSTRIADILIISSSTVRFHQQNIYRKLGVHSRQDFIDLVHDRKSPADDQIDSSHL